MLLQYSYAFRVKSLFVFPTVLILFSLSILPFFGAAQTYCSGWRWQVPNAPRQNAMPAAVAVPDSGYFYLASQGLVAGSNNGGSGWQFPCSNNLPGNLNFNAVHFANRQRGWAIGGGGSIFRTVNAGATWVQQPVPSTQNLVAIDFENTLTGYVLDHLGGLLKTNNGGLSWTNKYNFGMVTTQDVHFVNPMVGWVVGDGLWKTTDGGNTWADQSPSPLYFGSEAFFVDTLRGYVLDNAGFQAIVWKTNDGGESWTSHALTGMSGTDIWFTSPTTGFALGATSLGMNPLEDALMRTDDGGLTWTAVPLPTSGWNVLSAIKFVGQYGIISGENIVLETTNGGMTWTATALNTSPLQTNAALDFVDSQVGYLAGEYGIYKTANGGGTWANTLPNLPQRSFNDVFFVSRDSGWAAQRPSPAAMSDILKTTNGGSAWTTISLGTTDQIFDLYFLNKNTGFCVGENGSMFRTNDGGNTWETVTTSTSENLYSVMFTSATTGWIVGQNGMILKSTNGGNTWSAQVSGVTDDLNSVFFVDGLVGYAVGEQGIILRTTNSGFNWDELVSGTTNNLNSIVFSTPAKGWAMGVNGTILQTTNGGNTWTPITVGVNQTYNFHSPSFVRPDLGWAISIDPPAVLRFRDCSNINSSTNITLCQGETYQFNGQTLSASGTYTAHYVTSDGCDSVATLNLVVNPTKTSSLNVKVCPGQQYSYYGTPLGVGQYVFKYSTTKGCDSAVTVSVSAYTIPNTAIQATVCEGDAYIFFGQELYFSGQYSHTLTGSNGCDSIVTLNLVTLTVPGEVVYDGICAASTYFFNGQNLTNPGVYYGTFTSINGCDSLVELHLTQIYPQDSAVTATTCANEPYVFGNQSLTAAGVYVGTFVGQNGCDSVVTLTLGILPVKTSTVSAAICPGDPYLFNGQILKDAGTYVANLTAANGCDSTVTLNLSFLAVKRTDAHMDICPGDTITYRGNAYFAAGVYADTLTGVNGCDSILTLSLTVKTVANTPIMTAICAGETYNFHGTVLAQVGIYKDTLTGVNGCDSIVTLTLSVLPVKNTAIAASICANQTYPFDGKLLQTAGVYKDTLTTFNGCDSIITLTLQVKPTKQTAISATICAGDSYAFNSINLTVAGTYTKTVSAANGCDSTITLTLSVRPVLQANIMATICPGDAYAFNGQSLTSAGAYKDTLTAQTTGCDSILTLHLTIAPVPKVEINVSICAGGEYLFQDSLLRLAGTYTDTLATSMGCDSIVELHLTVRPMLVTMQTAAICLGDSLDFQGQTLYEAGTYTAFLNTIAGCDSMIVLTLQVRLAPKTKLNVTICANEPYGFNGINPMQSGTYTATLLAANGCDSTVTLHLTVLPTHSSTLTETICANETYLFNGQALHQSGTYTETMTATNGCDSVVTLNLAVLPVLATSLEAGMCSNDSLWFNGQYLTQSGTYVAQYTAVNGCDSTVTLQLSVANSIVMQSTAQICFGDTLFFGGQLLTETGNYQAVFTANGGCDSTVMLYLNVRPVWSLAIEATICSGETYTFQGQSLAQSGVYSIAFTSVSGCDSLVTLALTVLPSSHAAIAATICKGETYTFDDQVLVQPGTYTKIYPSTNGCDSTVTLTLNTTAVQLTVIQQGNSLKSIAQDALYQWIDCLNGDQPIPGANAATFTPAENGQYAVRITQNGCTGLSDCYTVTLVGTAETTWAPTWTLLPNPAEAWTSVVLTHPTIAALTVELFDLTGKRLTQNNIQTGETRVELNLEPLPAGMYWVKVSDGRAVSAKRLIKGR